MRIFLNEQNFAKTMNLRGIVVANISENKSNANKKLFTVITHWHRHLSKCVTCCFSTGAA